MIALALTLLTGFGLVTLLARSSSSSGELAPPAAPQPASPATIADAAAQSSPLSSSSPGILEARSPSTTWQLPPRGEPYGAAIAAAEVKYNLPPMLWARQLWQESRFREDIITGKVRDAAGSIGIAQFQAATAAQYGVDPLDPFASIDAGARYMRDLYNRFGTWSLALAAYNWGPENVARKGYAAAPASTKAYVSSILADVGLST